MKSRFLKPLLAIALAIGGSVLPTIPASASYYVTLDQFVVTKNQNDGVNGPVYLNDTFSDYNPPPSSEALYPSGLNSPGYITRGTFAESGGRVIADSTNNPAITVNGYQGGNYDYDEAVFATNAQPLSVSSAGLKSDTTFQVRGLFDLSSTLLPQNSASYNIELTDAFGGDSSSGNEDTLRLGVAEGVNGNLRISFRHPEFADNTIVQLAEVPLETNHKQIVFELTKATTSGPVTASYAYVDSPVNIADPTAVANLHPTQLNGSVNIFHGEDFTRAGFYVTERTDPPPTTTPLPSQLIFPIQDKLPVYVLTQAGGVSADKSSGSFCGTSINAQPLDPCHSTNHSYYAVDFTLKPTSGAIVSGSDTIVAAGGGTVKLVTAETFVDANGTYWSPKVAINNGPLNGGADLWTIYQEFGKFYYDPSDATAAAAAYNQAINLISVHLDQAVSSGTPLGTLPGDAHLHFQLGYGCAVGIRTDGYSDLGQGCSTRDVGTSATQSTSPLSSVTVDQYHMTDLKLGLNGTTCTVSPNGASVTAGCDPTRAQFGSSLDPKLPSTDNGKFLFSLTAGSLGLGTTVPIFVDPAIATGYDFQIGPGPLFSSVILPMIGDGLFDLYKCDDSQGNLVFDGVVSAGMSHSFGSTGTSCFRVLGIETSAALDSTDPNAFVTGLTFTGEGSVDFTMTAVTENVPEPESAALVLTGLLLGWRTRRIELLGRRR